MQRLRRWLLIVAPLPILSASWSVSYWARGEPTEPHSNHVVAAAIEPRVALPINETPRLKRACDERAEQLQRQLGADCRWIVRTPFVIAGDLPAAELVRWHEQTIAPAAKALAHGYFETPPDAPITILLFASESSYNEYARRLFGDEGISVYGYYRPHLRTLVMNISTGGGTLVHELTHALAAFDFPRMPDWFNEGLASLHEACRIHDGSDGNPPALEGLVNWRLAGLQRTVRSGSAPSLRELTIRNDFRTRDVGLNYAQARYLCLFLQQRGLLHDCYRRIKHDQTRDPTGSSALLSLFPGKDWAWLDTEFCRWVLELE